jgi:hypothetical protein
VNSMAQLNSSDVVNAVAALPSALAELLVVLVDMPGLVVAGGYLRAVVAGDEEVRDVDVFASSPDQACSAAALYADRTSSLVHRSKNAHTVGKVQFVHRWTFRDPQSLLDNFDFVVCKAALWYDGAWQSLTDPQFYFDVLSRRLTYAAPEREEGAADAVLRLLKYYRKGYRASRESLAKVLVRFVRLSDADPQLEPSHVEKLLAEVDRGSDEDGEVYL